MTQFVFLFGDTIFRNWRDGSIVKNSCSSCRRPKCSSQYPFWVAYNFLLLSFRGSDALYLPSWAPAFTSMHTQHINKNK